MDKVIEPLFKDILKRERALRGWSQADVAAKIGSDPKTVSRWERGLTSPSPYLTQQLCTLYGKTVQELGLIKIENTPPTQDEQDLVHSEEPPPPLPETSSAPSQMPSELEQKAMALLPHATPQSIPKKRLTLLLTFLLIFTSLLSSGSWLLPHNPYTSQGSLTLHDSLKVNTAASWALSNNDEGQCFFANDAYHIRGIKPGGYMKLCVAAETFFSNFTYEVNMRVVIGDCGGMAFRTTFPQLYYFLVCQDGKYRLVRYDRDHIQNRRIMIATVSSAIHKGLNTTNTLAIVANGDTIILYINHVQVYQGIDKAYFDGQIGLLAHTCSIVYLDPRPDVCAVPVEVAFSNAKVWEG